MPWTTLHLRVVTPLFGGDDPDSASAAGTPIRVPSIRGVLRFWFRAVAAGHGVTDLQQLWQDEEAVFGSTRKPSPIGLRVRTQPGATGKNTEPDWATYPPKGRFHGAQYLLGQGLWNYKTGVTRSFVFDKAVDLDIRFSQDHKINARFMLTLWAWLTYGDLGARTRRGFGQLACTKVTGDLPGRWSTADLKPPATENAWTQLGEQALPAHLRAKGELDWPTMLDGRPDADEALPEFPALTPRWWGGRMLDGTVGSLDAALHLAGQEWRAFRAVSDPRKEPTPNTRSPEWVHVIHGDDIRYPIAALGLPVGYFSKAKDHQSEFKATVEPYHDGQPLRRASPVWLRPVRLANGKWGVFTHVFWARLLPEDAKLTVSGSVGKDLDVPDRDDSWEAWDAWLEDRDRLPRSFPRDR